VDGFSVEMRRWGGKGSSRSGLGSGVVFVGGDGGALVVEDLPAGGGSVPEGGVFGEGYGDWRWGYCFMGPKDFARRPK